MSYSVPLVKFGRTVINLANVDYAVVRLETYPKNQWVLTIFFATPIANGRTLRWTYDNETDALAGLDRFQALNEQFVISEFP